MWSHHPIDFAMFPADAELIGDRRCREGAGMTGLEVEQTFGKPPWTWVEGLVPAKLHTSPPMVSRKSATSSTSA